MLTNYDLKAIKNLITSSLKPIEDRMGGVEGKLGGVEEQLCEVDGRLGGLEAKIDNLEKTNAKNHREFMAKMKETDNFLDKDLMALSRKMKKFEEYYPVPFVN